MRFCGIEDEHAIGQGIEQRVQPDLFLVDLGVQLGILHGNGCLVGKAAQQGIIVGGEYPGVAAEDEQQADHLLPGDQRQANAGQQAQAGGVGQLIEQAVDLGDLKALRVFVIGDFGEEALDEL